MNPTTTPASPAQLAALMSERMTSLTRTLASWMHEQQPTLAEAEHHVMRLLKELGTSLVTGLCTLAVPADPPRTIACACGQLARYQRQRPAQITTLFGTISITRPYYLCAACGQGQHPLDAQLHLCAGSRSPALDELLALLGATQESFAQAAAVLERLTLVHVSPNSVRQATEQLGAVLLAEQAGQHAAVPAARCSTQLSPKRLYVTMDGVMTHLHDAGWSELKVGCCYQTCTRSSRKHPDKQEIHAHRISYTTSLAEAHTFGWYLWEEAVRRGVLTAEEVVVVADGAHWIWNIAQTHFPRATQRVDWYHASAYVWAAGSAIWDETGARRDGWAKQQLDRLWEGQVAVVLEELEQWRACGEAVAAALSYYTTHQRRMDYASYRARGLQIGSGSAESGCKQVVSARLKQAGMIWNAAGAEAVAIVRAWLKSERWEEALALRGGRRRSYRRKQARRAEERVVQEQAGAKQAKVMLQPLGKGQQQALSADVLAQVQADVAAQRSKNVWARQGAAHTKPNERPQTELRRPAIAT